MTDEQIFNDDEDGDALTKDDVLDLFIRRQQLWLEASVMIVNLLPAVWDVIEDFIAEHQNATNLLLNDLKYDPTTMLMHYSVFEKGSTVVFNIPIPLSLAVDAWMDEGLTLREHLEKLPRPVADVASNPDTQEARIKSQLHATLTQYPDMYMDIDRLTELEMQSAAGKMFKYPTTDTKQ